MTIHASGITSTPDLKRCWSASFSQLVVNQKASPEAASLVVKPFNWTSDDPAVFDAGLREWRNENMANIAAVDIAGLAPVKAVLEAVTTVAEFAIQSAVAFHHHRLRERYGVCLNSQNQQVLFTVLGMGKLGGGELNFSSDIDLICLYDQTGVCDGPKALTAEEFFSFLVKAASKSLGAITQAGFVFRVDLRLRPYGGAGPLVMHFDQAESYYEKHGRDWERYAFIKARPVAGDIDAGCAFLRRLRPFIYRRYLDFTALHGLRDLKQKIEQQYALKRLDDNVKLGRGGIREIEFIAQSFQLVRAGQQVTLQTQSLYAALTAAKDLGLVEAEDCKRLTEAYEFLRVVENRLQQRADQQVHHLPQTLDEQRALAEVCGYTDWAQFQMALQTHRDYVHSQFCNLLLVESAEPGAPQGDLSTEVDAKVGELKVSQHFKQLSDRARGYAEHILSNLGRFDLGAETEVAQLVILKILDQIWGRTTYLALLAEQPQALNRLAYFVSRSSWMAEQIIEQPYLLDDLLDERNVTGLPDLEAKHEELRAQFRLVPGGDLEQAMDACRRFKTSMQFRIAAADVAGALPVMRVSDHLTELAEVVLQQSLAWVAEELQGRTGRPRLLQDDGSVAPAQMLVVGYGKLGGLELGYGSDLDIVLLHDASGKAMGTDGAKSLDNAVYFQRLGQRFVHFLSANTPAGRLYEIDTRLRPSGASGFLVTSLQAYEKYQQENAWVWEHQALVRARPVAGPVQLCEQFQQIRSALLQQVRSIEELKQEVVAMRDKMRAHLDDSDLEKVNLKHGPGGLVDIEFICQFLVLAYANKSVGDFYVTDNVRQIASLRAYSVLSDQQAEALTNAYLAIRNETHHQRLGVMVSDGNSKNMLEVEREQVVAIWQELLE